MPDLTRKTPPKVGPFKQVCECGEMLIGETDEDLFDKWKYHINVLHPAPAWQWAEAAKRIEEARQKKVG